MNPLDKIILTTILAAADQPPLQQLQHCPTLIAALELMEAASSLILCDK